MYGETTTINSIVMLKYEMNLSDSLSELKILAGSQRADINRKYYFIGVKNSITGALEKCANIIKLI